MLESIIDFFLRLIDILKIISAIICIILAGVAVWLAQASQFWEKKILTPFVKYRQAPQADTPTTGSHYSASREWDKIITQLESGSEASWKLSIIEADKLVDTALKEAGVAGQTMGERMKSLSEATLPSIQELWQVHRLRNHLVHTADFVISEGQARKAISIFEKVLKDLKAL